MLGTWGTAADPAAEHALEDLEECFATGYTSVKVVHGAEECRSA